MGVNKAFLTFQGSTLLQRAKAIADQVCERVLLVGSRELYGAFGECIEDIYRDCGPLAGIHVALLNSTTPHSMIIAVDTPFLSAEFLNYLIERALESSATVTAPRISGMVQPLCAVFARDFLPLAEVALRAGRYKIEPTFPQGRTLIVAEADLGPFEKAAEMFENLNTPEDLERARKRVSGQHS